jgi:dolichyl-phosphate-mannose-protein mannosyltransferase
VKVAFSRRELAIVIALLLLAFLVRFAFFSNQGYQIDSNDFKLWFQHAAEVGPRTFYSNNYWCDYPPFNIYFFWLFGLLAKSLSAFGTGLALYIVKLPSNVIDLGTAFLIFAFIRKYVNFKQALVVTALYAFNPAVVFNAAVWGQFDAIYTFFLVLSLLLVLQPRRRWTVLAVVAFMLGVLTKPQSVALAPLFVYLALRKLNWNLKGIIISLSAAVATVFAVILPFEWTNPITFISSKYFGAYATYQYTSINAFNIWAFGGMWIPDSNGFINSNIIGWILFAALAAFTIYFVHKSYKISPECIAFFGAFVLFFGFFMLPTRIHERYLFPAMAMLVLLFPLVKKSRILYVVLTATCFANEAYVLNALVAAYPNAADLRGDPVVFVVSLINSLALLYVLSLMVGELRGKHTLTSKTPEKPPLTEGAINDAINQA